LRESLVKLNVRAMKKEINDYRRFDVPPVDLFRMACGINAVIEVCNLHVNKLKEVDFDLVADTVKKIKRYPFAVSNEGFISILIQDIIDTKCRSKVAVKRVMELCDQKLQYFLKTRMLI
jgi:hypothetical protein